jgi:SAM-dependent methyltransferase
MASRFFSWGEAPELAAEYQRLVPKIAGDPGIRSWAANYCGHHAGRCSWDAAFIAKYSPRRILNVGAAPFIFEAACRRAGIRADFVSLDLAPDRFRNLDSELGVNAVKLDIERAGEDEVARLGRFDCIVFSELFEHLRFDLLGTMRRLARLLDPEGRLYLATPNGGGVKGVKRVLFQRRSGPDPVSAWSKLERLGHMGHVREYTAREVQAVLKHCGFAIERQIYRHHRRPTLDSAFKRALYSVMPGLAENILIVARKKAVDTEGAI